MPAHATAKHETEATAGPTRESKNPRKGVREFDEAIYAALLTRAQSAEAQQLVGALVRMVVEHECATRRRVNMRKKTQEALRQAVERFLADLLFELSLPRTRGYVFRPLRPGGFTGSAVREAY